MTNRGANLSTRTSSRSRLGIAVACAGLLFSLSGCGSGAAAEEADGYPVDRLTFVVPYAPGGTTDPLARQFAGQMEKQLGAKIVVENTPGAAGTVGTSKILSSQADGSTFGLTTGSALLVGPRTTEGLPYEGPDDWTVLGKMSATPYLLVVKDDAPWKTFEELLAAAKSSDVTVSTPGAFNPGDLVLEQLNSQVGGAFRATPFSGGGGEALAAILGGKVNAGVSALATATGQLEAGKLRALAAFSDKPLKLESGQEIPAITDLGYDATLNADFFVIAPPNLPEDLKKRLADASVETLNSSEFKDFVESTGGVPTPLNADAATADLAEQGKSFDAVFKYLDERKK